MSTHKPSRFPIWHVAREDGRATPEPLRVVVRDGVRYVRRQSYSCQAVARRKAEKRTEQRERAAAINETWPLVL